MAPTLTRPGNHPNHHVEWYSHQPVHRGNPNHQRPRHHHRNNRQVPLVPPGHQQHRHLGRKTRPLVGQSREKNHERPTVTPTQNTSLDHRGHRRRHGDSGFPAWVPGIQHQANAEAEDRQQSAQSATPQSTGSQSGNLQSGDTPSPAQIPTEITKPTPPSA